MNLLLAPDAFKESMTAVQAADAMRRGAEAASRQSGREIHVDLCPVSDGGAGLVEALVAAQGGERRAARVAGPLDDPVDAAWGWLGGADGAAAVIEMSAAAGLALVPPERRDPERTTTFGVGELILAALDAGASRLIVGIGNSGTCDGGAGMAAALGVAFRDERGEPIDRPAGRDLARIRDVDLSGLDQRLGAVRTLVACDVDNPLFGSQGSAHVYGPQKGASPKQVERLDAGLRNLAARTAEAGARADPETPGAGAAGGLGFGLLAFCHAELRRGVKLVLDAVDFHERAAAADLVLTGEGRLDGQSLRGKATLGVARAAAGLGTPTIALVGSVGAGWEAATKREGGPLEDVVVIAPETLSASEAIRSGPRLLSDATQRCLAARSGA